MKSSTIILLLLMTSCSILPLTNYKSFPPTKDVIITRQVRYISSTANELIFEMDLYYLKGYNYDHYVSPNYFLNYYLDSSFFSFASLGKFKFIDSAYATPTSVVPSAAVIAVDESGSYDSLDQFNSRSQGVAKLCEDFASPSQIMLGGFSMNGSLNQEPVDFISESFLSYNSAQFPLVFDLVKKTGGKCNLYDAVNASLDKLIASNQSTKNLIILAHANDNASTSTLNNVIAKATANQIQLHILYLGLATSANNLAKLAESTGGLFVSCPSSGELMNSFENLYSVLNGSANLYRARIKYQPINGNISSGQEFLFPINVHDNLNNVDLNTIVVYIKTP